MSSISRSTGFDCAPDLMPSDIARNGDPNPVGFRGRGLWTFQKGPIFANLILADEINRTPPKTQSALLEAMQERQVSVAGRALRLEEPFFVLATQNPIEIEGTYPLPEAQLDRFMFNVIIDYLSEDDRCAWSANPRARLEKPRVISSTVPMSSISTRWSGVSQSPKMWRGLPRCPLGGARSRPRRRGCFNVRQ